MSNYTSPFFGDRDLGQYTPPSIDTVDAFPIRNRADAVKYNSAGQVYEADVFVNTTSHRFSRGVVSMQDVCVQYTIEGQSDRPMAVLAIPSTYGNAQNTAAGQNNQMWAGAVNAFNDIPTYQYYIITKNNGASVTVRFDNAFDNPLSAGTQYRQMASTIVTAQTTQTTPSDDLPTLSRINPVVYSDITTATQRLGSGVEKFSYVNGFLWRLTQMDGNTTNGVKYRAYDENIGMIGTSVLARLGALIAGWTALSDSVIDDIYYTSLMGFRTGSGTLVPGTGEPVSNKYIGTYIATGLPVFTLDSFDQMVRYFQGDSWLSENGDLPPSDWSTDWDIYIKGAQKPEIYITMKSDKLDEWLENLDENKSGIGKSDIKVEYRYPAYPDPKSAQAAPVNILYGTNFELTEWVRDSYDEKRNTSYIENITLNYPMSDMIVFANEFRDTDVIQYQYYAQMQFRLRYGKYKSTWCRYKIGVIGSPSVPDFAQMQNEGVQDDDWQDDSTVTLHYDVYPPGFDPYPVPPLPPSPTPKPTDPSPTINGTGLLSTTYKITENSARALGRFFWGKELFQKIKALNLSPIENVVALTYMPINIAGSTSVIVIGDVDTNINGDKIGNTTPIYDLGSVTLPGRYGSFLDFAPYTTAHIFLPFVGFVPIDPQVFTNKTLSVKYSYDLIAGVCNAMLFANGIYVESHQGNCGIDIPLVASNRAEIMLGIVTSLASTALSPVNPASNLGLDLLNMGSNIVDAASSFHASRQGSYSPACAWTETRECYLVLETPNCWMGTTYAHDYGRPFMGTANIGQLNGFTVCDQTIDVSGIGGATEEEKTKIRELLSGGFYA